MLISKISCFKNFKHHFSSNIRTKLMPIIRKTNRQLNRKALHWSPLWWQPLMVPMTYSIQIQTLSVKTALGTSRFLLVYICFSEDEISPHFTTFHYILALIKRLHELNCRQFWILDLRWSPDRPCGWVSRSGCVPLSRQSSLDGGILVRRA